jgi:uncharacterized protein (UPF0210 family)
MKIRAVTVGAPLRAPLARDGVAAAGAVTRAAVRALTDAGWEVQTTRLATPPLHTVLRDIPDSNAGAALDFAASLEVAAAREGIGYVALGAIDTFQDERTWRSLLDAVPGVIAGTNGTFCAATVATRHDGINLAATRACGDLVARIAGLSADGFGNLRFAALANCGPDIPFFPAAYHDGGEAMTLGVALEAADLAVAAFDGAASLDEARARLIGALTHEAQRVTDVARGALDGSGRTRFAGVDLSLAPFPADDRSIASAFERLGLPAFGTNGTLFLAAFLTECLQRVAGALGTDSGTEPGTTARRFGFSGLMLPVLEDSVLARRAAEGTFGVDSLLLYSAVCGLGLDTVPLPGDTSPGELGAIILDVAALALRLDKPLTARLFPVPGKRAGDAVSWDFAFFAPSRVVPVRGLAPNGVLGRAETYNPVP